MGHCISLKAIALTAILAATAHAADLVVSPAGPYTTIQAAIDAAANGDTVTIADGTWAPALHIAVSKNITLRSANGPDNCRINTQISLDDIAQGNVRIEGLTIRRKIWAEDVNRLIFDDCVLTYASIALQSRRTTCELYRCRIHEIGSSGDWPALSIDWSPGPVIFDGCTIMDICGHGIYIGAPQATFRNCVFSTCMGRAITATGPCRLTNCTVINNQVGLATKNDLAVIDNCIFWGNVSDVSGFESAIDRPESIAVRNSFIMQGWPGENVYRNDPKITREGWLQSGSPCIDAGIPADHAAADVDGETRVQNEIVDIGADEYQDQDGDGLPDHWETRYFDSPTVALLEDDDDDDGLKNIEEYVGGSSPHSTYWYVDAAQLDDSGDGRSWQTAKKTISAAMTMAGDEEIVVVADGQYTEYAYRGKATWLKSANGPEHCTLQLATFGVVLRNSRFILDGFTILATNPDNPVLQIEGQALTLQNCIISGGKYGIGIHGAGAVVRNCRIANNVYDGIYMPGDYGYPRMLRLENCEIDHNGGYGVNACHARNVFPRISLRDCWIHDNYEAGFWSWAVLDVARCRFEGNGGCGFGITSPDMVIRDCVIAGNCWRSPLFGLGISSPQDRPAQRLLVENCTIAHNVGQGGIGGFAQGPYTHETVISNCIVWKNRIWNPGVGQINVMPDVSYTVEYTDIQAGWEGLGNIDEEPFFADPGCLPRGLFTNSWTGGDYRLLSFSPCINAGDPDYVTAEGGTDAAGNPRFLHGRIDMGAYEKACADFRPDAQIDAADLMAFASHWLESSCEGPAWCAGADLTLDGRVDTHDLTRFAAEWALNTQGPAAWWLFDETSGTVAADNSLFNNIAVLYNTGVNCWVPGRIGNALSLDGGDDYVKVDLYTPPAGDQSRTVAAWISTTDTSGVIIAWGPDGTPGARWTLVTEAFGRLRLEVGGGAIVGTTNICDNRWHCVAAVLNNDGTPNVNDVILYVDGTREITDAPSDRIIETLPGNVYIGGNTSSTNPRMFSGCIDDVRIYDRALSPEEIAELAK